MLDVLATLAGEALITLAGPVAISAFKSAKAPRKQVDVLRRALNDSTLRRASYSLPLAYGLKKEKLSPEQNAQILRFLTSAEGSALIRLVAVECVSNPESSRKLLLMLASEARALLELYADEVPGDDAIAIVLVTTLRETLVSVYRNIEKYDSGLAEAIRLQAFNQRQSTRLADTTHAELERTRTTRSLIRETAAEMKQSIVEYARLLEERVSTLAVPTVQGDIRAPLDKIFIHRRIAPVSSEIPNCDGVLDLLTRGNQFVLLGNPGEGKSTLVSSGLRDLASRSKAGALDAVPIKIQLRHFARVVDASHTGKSLLRYITDSARAELESEVTLNTWQYFLRLGRCVIFFDGLDEILSVPLRKEVVTRIEAFVARYRLNSFVVTSREADYPAAPLNGAFGQTRLLPFTEGQVATFAARFFSLVDMPEGRDDPAAFMRDTKSLEEVRSNALMLGVLCNLYSTGRRMPRNRLDLYARCADMLFSDWDSRKGILVSVDDEVSTELAVRELALAVFMSGDEEFADSWLRNLLKSFYLKLPGSNPVSAGRFAENAMALWRGRKWLITYVGTKHGEDFYTFTHRTFLEFFAAEHLVYASNTAVELCRELEPLFTQRSSLTFCLLSVQSFVAGKLHAGSDFLEALLQTADKLQEQGLLEAAYYALDFGLQALPFMVRARNDLRLQLTQAMTKLISVRLPSQDGLYLETQNDHARLTSSGKESRESRSSSTVVDLLNTYSNLAHLNRRDVLDHLATIKITIEGMLRDDFKAGFRMCVATYFATWSASWVWTGGRSTVRKISYELVHADVANGVYDESRPDPDYRSMVGGLAMGVDFDPKWISTLNLTDMFQPVSNMDLPPTARVSLAHLLCGSILEWQWSSNVAGQLSAGSVRHLTERASVAITEGTDLPSFVGSAPGASLITRKELSKRECFVVVGFLGVLNKGGGSVVESVLKESEQSSLVTKIRSAMRFRASPGAVPTVAIGRSSSTNSFRRNLRVFMELIPNARYRRALYRLWRLGSDWQLFENRVEEQEKVAVMARAAARQLASEGHPGTLAEVEALLTDGVDGRPNSVGLFALKLAVAAAQAYAALEKRQQKPSRSSLTEKIVSELPTEGLARTLREGAAINIVVNCMVSGELGGGDSEN